MTQPTRRQFLAASCATFAAGVRPLLAAPTKRPNILMIFADQISMDALSSSIGHKYLNTPNLDALRARSLDFSRAYCANPLCVPSRTAIFTGRYPVETGAQSNDKTSLDPAKFPCMATHFRAAGYRTAYFGKWHLLYPEKESQAEVHGFEHMASEVVDTETAAHVVEYLAQSKAEEKPFFAVASFLNPHNICEWARGDKLNQGDIGAPPAADMCPPLRANHGIPKDEPDIMTLMRESYHASPLFPVGNFDDAKWKQYLWAYYRLIERVDGLIGQVLTALTASGLAEDTVVLFTGDHGDCQGAHHFNQKTVLYEECERIPLYVSYPRRVRAGKTEMLVNTGVDLQPTLCEFAGIPVPKPLRGVSLLPVATGRDPHPVRPYVVTTNHMVQGGAVNGVVPMPQGRSLRSDKFKYTVYNEGTQRECLIDLTKDPGEMQNVAKEKAFHAVLQEHRGLLQRWGAELQDEFPYIAPMA